MHCQSQDWAESLEAVKTREVGVWLKLEKSHQEQAFEIFFLVPVSSTAPISK